MTESCELWSIGVMTVSTECLMSVPHNPSLSIIPSTPNDRQRSKSYNCLIVIVLRLEVMISCPGLLLRDWFLISWLQLLLSWVVKDDSSLYWFGGYSVLWLMRPSSKEPFLGFRILDWGLFIYASSSSSLSVSKQVI